MSAWCWRIDPQVRLVHRGERRQGFTQDQPEDKHGIRLSNIAALALNDVYVDADRLMARGQGLNQAQAVFGYIRLMGRGHSDPQCPQMLRLVSLFRSVSAIRS